MNKINKYICYSVSIILLLFFVRCSAPSEESLASITLDMNDSSGNSRSGFPIASFKLKLPAKVTMVCTDGSGAKSTVEAKRIIGTTVYYVPIRCPHTASLTKVTVENPNGGTVELEEGQTNGDTDGNRYVFEGGAVIVIQPKKIEITAPVGRPKLPSTEGEVTDGGEFCGGSCGEYDRETDTIECELSYSRGIALLPGEAPKLSYEPIAGLQISDSRYGKAADQYKIKISGFEGKPSADYTLSGSVGDCPFEIAIPYTNDEDI